MKVVGSTLVGLGS